MDNKEALYLYCIREKQNPPNSAFLKGIDERQDIFSIPYEGLEGIVSKVLLEEFDSATIQARAQNDLRWIKEKAVIHEKIIEEVMKGDKRIISVIPMKFGTIFKEEKNLLEALKKHYQQFKHTLKHLTGKQEWTLKAYLVDREKFQNLIKNTSPEIKEKEKEMASLSEGAAYFMEGQLKELLKKETDKELKRVKKNILERFKGHAEKITRGKILEKELTQRPEPMVLNISCLIRNAKLEDFKKEANRINGHLKREGLSLEYSGPWPPYNFVS